ncbi:integrase [Streptomyces sp. NPDC003032]
MTTRTRAFTPAEVLALPAMPSAKQAFAAMNVSQELGYALIRGGDFPLEVLRLGHAIRVRRSDLLDFLGIREDEAAPAA